MSTTDQWARDQREREKQAEQEKNLASLRENLLSAGLPEAACDVLTDLVSSTRKTWAWCPDCYRKVNVDYPDGKSQLKALEMVLGYLIGKPKERKEVEMVVSSKPLNEMSLLEKQEYLERLRQHELQKPPEK